MSNELVRYDLDKEKKTLTSDVPVLDRRGYDSKFLNCRCVAVVVEIPEDWPDTVRVVISQK